MGPVPAGIPSPNHYGAPSENTESPERGLTFDSTMTKATNNFTCSVTEAAEILQVHSSTVEKLIAGGELPAGRIGRAYVMRTSDVHRYAEKVILDQTAERLTKGHRPRSIRASLRIA